MSGRVCPECDTRTDAEVCPRCRSRTIRERRQGTEVRDPLLGRVLEGRYSIDSLIGRGGMGSVYRGVQLSTKQVVAIKVIRAESAEDEEAAKRFHREARAASLLSHPHTVRVIDFGESDDGDLYQVLEYLPGNTLGQAIRDSGRLPESRAAKIGYEVAQSLSEAHGRGLAHRDLKPDNIMLLDVAGETDFVKVLDFGIAKFLSGSSGESSVTRTGAVVGTPQYMAPEQAKGNRGLTPAVDVYSLGIVLYQTLTGRKPFDGDSALEILMKHAREPVPELPADLAVSGAMRGLVRSMLAKDPAGRPTAEEVTRVLQPLRFAAMAAPAPVPSNRPVPVSTPPARGQDVPSTTTPIPGPVPAPEEDESTRALPPPKPTFTVADRPARSRKGWLVVLGAVVVGLGGLGVWVLVPGGGPEVPGVAPATTPVPDPGPEPVPVPVPEPAPVPVPAVTVVPVPVSEPAKAEPKKPVPPPPVKVRPPTPKPVKTKIPLEN
jgi:serine/threonine-protein kinase